MHADGAEREGMVRMEHYERLGIEVIAFGYEDVVVASRDDHKEGIETPEMP